MYVCNLAWFAKTVSFIHSSAFLRIKCVFCFLPPLFLILSTYPNNMGGSINIISHQPSGKKRFCLKFQFTPPYTLQPKHFMFRCDSTCKIPNFICLPAHQHFWFYYETPQTRWNFDEGRKKTLLWFLYHIHQIFDVKTKRERKKTNKIFQQISMQSI